MTDFSLFDPSRLGGAMLASVSTAGFLEAVMLVCFGLAWPVENLRMLRTRQARGKGPAFTGLIMVGYVAGAASKLLLMSDTQALAPVFWLYVLNALSVAANVGLQWHFRPRSTQRLSGTRPKGRLAILALVCAFGLWTPITARSQSPGLTASVGCVDGQPPVGPVKPGDGRFSAAYGRFVQLADQGDAAAASAALFMFRHGMSLFGSDWAASEGQQARWSALALAAARHQAVVVSEHADD
jgi:hypothetical protein